MGEQYVGIDLHRRRSVIVRMTSAGEVLQTVRVDNDPVALSLELAKAGRPRPRGRAGGHLRLVLGRRPAAGFGLQGRLACEQFLVTCRGQHGTIPPRR